ncbi:hypothetical protein [Actinoplanes sp. NPDC023714]|uniref:hypothetical protein n=1 Tax=Actinoplanes sp. NPDC023714 TaxID=3154322 RepID=UPI00340FBC27
MDMRRDPWAFFDHDLESDPTVYVPYRVRLEMRAGGVIQGPAVTVRISEHNARIDFGPEPYRSVSLTDVAAGRVDLRPVPAALDELRVRHPWAYRIWRPDEAIAVYQWTRDGMPAEEIAERLQRPAEHVVVKFERVEALLRAARTIAPRLDAPAFGPPVVHEFASYRHEDEPPPWYAASTRDDPTVYLPCTLHIVRYGSQIDVTPPRGCELSESGWTFATDRLREHVRLTDLVAGHVDVHPTPDDLAELREIHHEAYRPWRPADAKEVLRWGRDEEIGGRKSGRKSGKEGGKKDEGKKSEGKRSEGKKGRARKDRLAAHLSRPAAHLTIKQRLLEATAAEITPPPRTEPAPYLRARHRAEGPHLVQVTELSPPRTVAERHGITPEKATSWYFAAHLTEEQITALRDDPEVDHIEEPQIFHGAG